MNKILKSFSMCGLGIAATLILATSKVSATNYRVNPSEGLNVRASGSISGQLIGALRVGTVVDVLETKNGWGKIRYNGRDGWVCMEYLRVISAAKQTYQVTDPDGLNVRSGPGTSHGKLGAICVGTKVDVTETRENWGKILYSGREGWICLDYARPVGAPVPAPSTSAPAPAPAPSSSTSSTGSNFTPSNRIVEFIKQSEGFVRNVSEDDLVRGVKQIGYGHVIQPGESYTSITEAQASDLLRRELASNYGQVLNTFFRYNNIRAAQQHFDALLSFTYNLGTGWMGDADIRRVIQAAGRNLSRVNRNDFAKEILAYHHVCNPDRTCILGLLYRRMCELNIFFEGDYTRRTDRSANHGYTIPDCIKGQW